MLTDEHIVEKIAKQPNQSDQIDPRLDEQKIINLGLSVLEIEASSISNLSKRLGKPFVKACQVLLACEGRVVVTGMGKSGHIGKKMAATFASTGTPAFFMHPGEASHGDLGMITPKDVVIGLSYSGETHEILTILPLIKRQGVPLITLTGSPHSTLAGWADVNLDISVQQEACPLGLAPTASTTATLAMGDALAVALLQSRGFTKDDFAQSHPGGSLGRKLLLKIDDIMLTGDKIPMVDEQTLLSKALEEISQKKLGMTTVVSNIFTEAKAEAKSEPQTEPKLVGIFTDGDLRRTISRGIDVYKTQIKDVMTTQFKSITVGTLAAEAVHIMETAKITALPVLNEEGRLVGALNIHDLFRARVM